MDNILKKYLYDILQCIIKIDNYIGTPKIFKYYSNNKLLQDAVERNFEIIGEATNRILKLKPDIAITNSRKIIDTRNKISHGYDDIEPENIWNIIINYPPTLKTEVEELLEENF